MLIDLSGQTAIVTGGASNIGRGISLELASSGARVVIFDRDVEQAERTCKAFPDRMSSVAVDLLDMTTMEKAVVDTVQRHGPVSILVNDAGWVNTIPFAEKKPDEMDLEIRLNLNSPIHLVHLVLPSMIERRFGRIVSIASEAGRAGQRGQAVYSAAKSGILGFTRTLAQEVGRNGITVNAVSPAMTIPESSEEIGRESMQQSRNRPPELMAKIVKSYPVGRVGHPRDIAYTVAFLCSKQAEFITGQTVPVNGGFNTI
jgi:2-hydroxycyclohexanecarboxyl-CoA dehydrogenase